MPNPISLRRILKVLKEKGFVFISQRGSHAKFRKKESIKRTVIVKTSKKEIPHGTFQSILLQSGLQENDFRKNKK